MFPYTKTYLRKFIIAPAIFVQGRFHQTAQHLRKKVATQRNGAAREHTIFHTTKPLFINTLFLTEKVGNLRFFY